MELGLGGAIGACVPSFLCGPCKVGVPNVGVR